MRHRMNTIIKLLENENYAEVRNLYERNPKYKKVLHSLCPFLLSMFHHL